MNLVLRNLRVAGRRDVVRLARTEDKLERVLQEVEQLRDELARAGAEAQSVCGQGEEGQDVTRVSRPWLRASEVLMSALRTLARLPRATLELANVSLTTPDAPIGQAPRDVVWTHRGTTLYRYYGEARRPCTEAITTKRPSPEARRVEVVRVREAPRISSSEDVRVAFGG